MNYLKAYFVNVISIQGGIMLCLVNVVRNFVVRQGSVLSLYISVLYVNDVNCSTTDRRDFIR